MTAIKSLSDKELLARMEGLRRREHKTTLEILIHLNEIERRRLHLKLGYKSLYDYCTKHLKYSASAACRRIQTARCVRFHPEVYELLEHEKVNLTTVSLIAPVLTGKNKRGILEEICGKGQREVEAIASRYRPPVAHRDTVKPVCVHVPDRSGIRFSQDSLLSNHSSDCLQRGGASQIDHSLIELSLDCSHVGSQISFAPLPSSGQSNSAISKYHRSGGRTFATRSQGDRESLLGGSENGNARMPGDARNGSESASEPEARVQQKLLIQFLADEAFMKKYEEARSLLSQRLPDTSFASVFDALMSEFLEHHSPARRKARRDKRIELQKAEAARAQQAAAGPAMTNPSNEAAPHQQAQDLRTTCDSRSRHIPAAVRDEVFVRDKGRCTYMGKTGKRCESTHALQIDHIMPFARGGPATASNLRLLCAKHNKIAAEEVFGERFTRQFDTGELFLHQQK